jgi:DNA helicase-2/ATP-dependent DNA helicase PcrA
MPTFADEFKRLNKEQQQAVETVEGPVMVVAGPGTGKTQVLAMRVANILKKTHAKPGNILCLTFSTSGASAMRERLRSLIGPDAYGVTVSTIHGFANDIIQQNPIVFDDWSALEQISDVERYRQINKIIDDLMPDLVLVSKKQERRIGRGR